PPLETSNEEPRPVTRRIGVERSTMAVRTGQADGPNRRKSAKKTTVVPLRLRLIGLIAVLTLGVGCPCVKGAVNASPSLRWWLFSNFGAQKTCPEMTKRGAPLKLDPNGNTIGRFFPTRCRHEVHDDRHTLTVHFGGTGYAWTPIAGRVGFSCDASVEYA